MSSKISLRNLNEYDWDVIEEAFKREGWQKYLRDYEGYFEAMKQETVEITIAQWQEDFAGILVINWCSEYENFKNKAIPEISDMRILYRFLRSGVDNDLMEEAEKRIFMKKEAVGIGVPLLNEYGLTQNFCVRRGYYLDGKGVYRGTSKLQCGDHIIVDEELKLYMLKDCDKKTTYKKSLIQRLTKAYYNIYRGKI